MDRDERYPASLEADRGHQQEAIDRAAAHLQRELLSPTHSESLSSLAAGLPLPDDDRPWTRQDQDAYFAREDFALIREGAEAWGLYREVPDLCFLMPYVRYDAKDRMRDVLRAEEVLAKLQNRPAALPLLTYSGTKHCLAFFNPDTYQIGLNNFLFTAPDPSDLLRAYLHEARHAYQFHAIHHPGAHPEMQPVTIEKWRQAERDYVHLTPDATPAEVAKNVNNLLEIDARKYVERRMRAFDER